MSRSPDLFSQMAMAMEAMGRSLGQEVDGLVSRTVQGLGRTGRDAEAVESPDSDDELVLGRVEEYLARGLELNNWWDAARTSGSFAERFELGRTFNEPSQSFGFFDHAPVAGADMPIMGNFQEMFFDQPKSPQSGKADAARWMRDQMREFVLHYFMRVSDFREPEGYSETGGRSASGWPELLSWCPREDTVRKGFGFQQLYYKRSDTGEVGKFSVEERFAIIDLREIGPTYEWIVVKVRIFDFNFTFSPFGPGNPQVVVPLEEESLLVLSRHFIRHQEEPEPGVLGRYGLGYAFIKSPTQGVLAYGPGEFEAAIELINFEIRDTGETRVDMAFVADRPQRLVNFSFDPIALGFRIADLTSLGMASFLLTPFRGVIGGLSGPRIEFDPVYAYVDLMNLLTGGAAAENLCISRDQLDQDFLVKHFIQHYQTIAGSLATWRLVCDWLDASSLPAWAIHGRSS